MSPTEKFAMCMAEAGFPVRDAWEGADGIVHYTWSGTALRANGDFWRSVHRSGRLSGARMSPCCEPCFVDRRLADERGVLSPCGHVEVSV